MSKSDVVAFAALGAIALAVAGFGGFLDPVIRFLNNNSGAVMGLAAMVTAAATVVLALLNRSSWKLYRLERDRERANELRIADAAEQQANYASTHAKAWRQQYREEQNVKAAMEGAVSERFERQLKHSRNLLDNIADLLPDWRRETRRPSTVKALTKLKRVVQLADTQLSLWEQGPPSGAEREMYARRFGEQFERLSGSLRAIEKSSRAED